MNIDQKTNELLHAVAEQAAIAALKKYKDDERKSVKKNAFNRTELLLKKYDVIMEHHKNTQLLDEDIEVVHENVKYSEIDDEDIYLKSVVRTRGRTEKMLRLIDKSMQSLKRQMEEKDKLNRYEAADLVYFRKMSFEDAAKQLNCDPKTVRRWKNEVVRELSGLMFGIDGFDLDF